MNNHTHYYLRAAILATAFLGAAVSASAQYSSPIHDVDNPARQTFKVTVNLTVPQGAVGGPYLVTVPVGKRLMVEYINIGCSGSPATLIQLVDFPSSAVMTVPVVNTSPQIFSILTSYPADPGASLQLQITASKNGSTGCSGVVMGHYVNLP